VRVIALIAGLVVAAGCAASGQTWESQSRTGPDAEWSPKLHAGEVGDPRQELVESCNAHWSVVGPPYEMRLTNTQTGQTVTVRCEDVQH